MSDGDSISNADGDGEVDAAVFGDPEALRALPRDRAEATLHGAAASQGGRPARGAAVAPRRRRFGVGGSPAAAAAGERTLRGREDTAGTRPST